MTSAQCFRIVSRFFAAETCPFESRLACSSGNARCTDNRFVTGSNDTVGFKTPGRPLCTPDRCLHLMESRLSFERVFLCCFLVAVAVGGAHSNSQPSPSRPFPVSISAYYRTRVDAWQWFAAPPQSETYAYVESLLRLGVAQKLGRWDWNLEL